MASHHHHHCHNPTMATAAPTCYCTCIYSPYSPCHHHPQPLSDPHHLNHHHPLPPPDLLHHPPPQHHPYADQPHLPSLHQYDPRFEERVFLGERLINPTISSLVRRIAALESALLRRSSSSSHSLRDAAARTIQTHFRAFLLHRSRTLRQLKSLASIKSMLSILKSSASEKIHFDYDIIYHKALRLRLKLDSIQGGDTMIRDGKSSIRRELNKFMDFIDGFCVESRGLPGRGNVRYGMINVKSRVSNSEGKLGNVKNRGLRRADEEELRGLSERIDNLAEDLGEETENPTIRNRGVALNRSGVLVNRNVAAKPKVNKSVSFEENGKVYRLLRKNFEPFSNEDCDGNADIGDLAYARELKDDRFREIEGIEVSSKEADNDDDEEESHSDDGDSLPSSDGGEKSKSYSKRLR